MQSDLKEMLESTDALLQQHLILMMQLAIYADQENATNDWNKVIVLDGIGHVLSRYIRLADLSSSHLYLLSECNKVLTVDEDFNSMSKLFFMRVIKQVVTCGALLGGLLYVL